LVLSPFLNTGVIELVFQTDGNTPFYRDFENSKYTGYDIESTQSAKKKPDIPSGPGELEVFKDHF